MISPIIYHWYFTIDNTHSTETYRIAGNVWTGAVLDLIRTPDSVSLHKRSMVHRAVASVRAITSRWARTRQWHRPIMQTAQFPGNRDPHKFDRPCFGRVFRGPALALKVAWLMQITLSVREYICGYLLLIQALLCTKCIVCQGRLGLQVYN